MHVGIATLKSPGPHEVIQGMHHHPQAKSSCLGPSSISLLTVTANQPLTKSDYTSLTLNTHSPLAPEVFSMVLWLSFASLSPLVSSSCLRHSRPGQMCVVWPPPLSLVFCTNTEWPQLFLTTSSLAASHPHLTIKCRWLFWGSPNGSVVVTQHLLGACSILGPDGGSGEFEALSLCIASESYC